MEASYLSENEFTVMVIRILKCLNEKFSIFKKPEEMKNDIDTVRNKLEETVRRQGRKKTGETKVAA